VRAKNESLADRRTPCGSSRGKRDRHDRASGSEIPFDHVLLDDAQEALDGFAGRVLRAHALDPSGDSVAYGAGHGNAEFGLATGEVVVDDSRGRTRCVHHLAEPGAVEATVAE
jgi:hypothetical protein